MPRGDIVRLPDPGLPWLVADIGGTNARFGWVQDPARGVEQVRRLAVTEHADLGDAVQAYLAALPRAGRAAPAPRRAAFAIASPIDGDADEVAFTNSPWRLSRRALRAALGLESLLLLNDFEALSLALPRLRPAQLRPTAGPAWSQPARGTLAVVGPGTGLGVGGVTELPAGRGWLALPGEGGHATLAPTDDFESELLAWVRRQRPHVSAERLLSGTGLPLLHAAVAAVHGAPAPATTPLDSAVAVITQALAGDADAGRTIDTFCALLGSFAGNVALTLGARGGVAIGGGIVPRLGERFFASRFRERFEAKGRFAPYLAAVPTALISDTLAALDGALLALEQSTPD